MNREVDDHWKHWSGQDDTKNPTDQKLKSIIGFDEPETVSYYFTFGFNQGYDNGYKKITVPVGPHAYQNARTEMVRQYGTKWGFQYTEEQFLPQLKRWPLWEVK